MPVNGLDSFVRDYVNELHAGTAAIFAGAGLSMSAGFVDWVGLLQPLADNLGLDAKRESDHLVALAQYHVNANGMNRSELHKRLLEEFPADKAPTDNHRLLARLPVSVYWTTNYDRLIERSLEDAGKIVDPKISVGQLSYTQPRRDVVVYKMHGDIGFPQDAVLTKDDYEKYSNSNERGAFVNALTGDLVSKTFLFLGFSFKDPNLDYILSRIRVTFKQNARQHYCIFKRVKRDAEQKDEEFEYQKIKQQLAIEDLKRFNIKTLLVDEYSEITELLRRVERAYRRRTLFISGSAEAFGDWKKEDVSDFLNELGKVIIQRKLRLVSGFGLGLSNELLSGAIEQIYTHRVGHINDFLVVRPFPRHIVDAEVRAAVWHRFRQDLISQAGIALFLFGNKCVDDKIVAADGVLKEYEIARELDLVTLPVGATGYVAEDLAKREEQSVQAGNASDAFKRVFAQLQVRVERPQELISRIVDAIDEATKL